MSWGPLGKASLALPAAPGVTSREGRARSPAPAACQRRRPATRSCNSALRLRCAGRCPYRGVCLAKGKPGKTTTKALFFFLFLIPFLSSETFQGRLGPPAPRGLEGPRREEAEWWRPAVGSLPREHKPLPPLPEGQGGGRPCPRVRRRHSRPARRPPPRPRRGRLARQSDGGFLGVAEQHHQRHLKIHLLLAASA